MCNTVPASTSAYTANTNGDITSYDTLDLKFYLPSIITKSATAIEIFRILRYYNSTSASSFTTSYSTRHLVITQKDSVPFAYPASSSTSGVNLAIVYRANSSVNQSQNINSMMNVEDLSTSNLTSNDYIMGDNAVTQGDAELPVQPQPQLDDM